MRGQAGQEVEEPFGLAGRRRHREPGEARLHARVPGRGQSDGGTHPQQGARDRGRDDVQRLDRFGVEVHVPAPARASSGCRARPGPRGHVTARIAWSPVVRGGRWRADGSARSGRRARTRGRPRTGTGPRTGRTFARSLAAPAVLLEQDVGRRHRPRPDEERVDQVPLLDGRLAGEQVADPERDRTELEDAATVGADVELADDPFERRQRPDVAQGRACRVRTGRSGRSSTTTPGLAASSARSQASGRRRRFQIDDREGRLVAQLEPVARRAAACSGRPSARAAPRPGERARTGGRRGPGRPRPGRRGTSPPAGDRRRPHPRASSRFVRSRSSSARSPSGGPSVVGERRDRDALQDRAEDGRGRDAAQAPVQVHDQAMGEDGLDERLDVVRAARTNGRRAPRPPGRRDRARRWPGDWRRVPGPACPRVARTRATMYASTSSLDPDLADDVAQRDAGPGRPITGCDRIERLRRGPGSGGRSLPRRPRSGSPRPARSRKRSSWAWGSANVPSNSTGFCVASTMNGSGSGRVTPSIETWRSCIASSSAAWVRGVARLISSTSRMWVKTGPGDEPERCRPRRGSSR